MDLEQWSKHLVYLLGYRLDIDELNPVIHQGYVQNHYPAGALKIRPKQTHTLHSPLPRLR